MAYGTAPHKTAGVWYTRTGRRLSPAGQRYWEQHYQAGAVSQEGHVNRENARLLRRAKRGDKAAGVALGARHKVEQEKLQRQGETGLGIATLGGSQLVGAVGKDVVRSIQKRRPQVAATKKLGSEWVVQPVRHAAKHPTSPLAVAEGIGGVAAVIPGFGVGRAARAIKGASEAERAAAGARQVAREAGVPTKVASGGKKELSTGERMATQGKHRMIVVGRRAVQDPAESTSRLVRKVQRAVDRKSMEHPNLPIRGARDRGLSLIGRETKEARRSAIDLADQKHAPNLPKEGSPEDIAHSWWMQFAPHRRTQGLLHTIRDKYQKNLDDLTSGRTPMPKGKIQKADVEARAADLSHAIARLTTAIDAKVKLDPKIMAAMEHYSGDRKGVLIQHAGLDPVQAAERELLPQRWLTGATYTERTPGRLGKVSKGHEIAIKEENRLQGLFDRAMARSVKKNAIRVPATREQAIQRLHEVEAEHDAFIEAAKKTRRGFGKHDPGETARRNIQRQIYKKSGGVRGQNLPTLEQEFHQGTIDAIDRMADAEPDAPWAKAYSRQRDEIVALRNEIQDTDPLFGTKHPSEADFGMTKRFPNRSKFDPTVTKLGGALSVAKDRRIAYENARLNRMEPTGIQGGNVADSEGAMYLGHRPYKPTRMENIKGTLKVGVNKVRPVPGMGKENKMQALDTGRFRMSTHQAREDWIAAQTFPLAQRIRRDLNKIGDKAVDVLGHIPDEPVEGYTIINTRGALFPRSWKSEMLAKASNDEELAKRTKEVFDQSIGQDPAAWRAIVQEARSTGVADQLRVISNKDLARYQAHFTPHTRPGPWLKKYDQLTDFAVANIIIGRLGFVPKQIAQNVVLSVPQMGWRLFSNVARGVQLSPLNPNRTEAQRYLFKRLWSEVSGGAGGAVAIEAQGKYLRKFGEVSTRVGDSVPRVAAMLHALANEGVISKANMHLSEKDIAAINKVMDTKEGRMTLARARQKARDMMGDFDRFTPQQRANWRRLVMVPNWLMAGTRLPVQYAVHHPFVSGAAIYAGAGEPGSPVKLNKPVTSYLAEGLPSWAEGVDVPGGKTQPITSILPASIPADIGFKLRKGQFTAPGDYMQPTIRGVIDTASSQITGSHGTYHTDFLNSLEHNLERFTPSEKFARQMISPPENPKTYRSDKTRLGRLVRELGGPAAYEHSAGSQDQGHEIPYDLHPRNPKTGRFVKRKKLPVWAEHHPGESKQPDWAR